MKRSVLNLGSLFSGVDALCRDGGMFDLLNVADVCVVQAPDLLGQSNRFYRVHPRRNDRFLAPTQDLRYLYPEVDLTDVHFVRHLLTCLHGFEDARFEVVADELRSNWVRQVGTFLQRLKSPVILLRLQVLRDAESRDHPEFPGVCVTDQMMDTLANQCADFVDVTTQVSGQSDELEDMLFGTMQQPMAEHMIGPAAHRAIAAALLGPVRNLN